MLNFTPSRFRTLHLISAVRLGLLTVALVAATAPLLADDDAPLSFDPSWTLNLHQEYAGADGSLTFGPDGKSLQLAYDFTKGGSFISANRTLTSTSTFHGIEIKAKGFASVGVSISDSTGQVFVYQLGVPGDAEKTYNLVFDSPHQNFQSFGGAKDKVVHFPLKSVSILASKNKDELSGTLEVTEVLLQAQ